MEPYVYNRSTLVRPSICHLSPAISNVHQFGLLLRCCSTKQHNHLTNQLTNMWLGPSLDWTQHFRCPIPESPFQAQESIHQARTCYVQCDSPVAELALFTFLKQIYDAVKLVIMSDRMSQLEIVNKRPGSMPLRMKYDSLKVMLIAMILCLTVSSCQTLYSVIGESTINTTITTTTTYYNC